MRFAKALLIALKDIEDMSKSKYVFLSIIFMPILLGVGLPAIQILPFMGMSPDEASSSSADAGIMDSIQFTDDWATLDETQRLIVFMIEMSLFMFLLIPLIMPTVTASDSFVGEKDRGTAEGLVVAPITDSEIYWGKVMGSLIPTMGGLWAAGIGFVILVNYASNEVLGYSYYPVNFGGHTPIFIAYVVFLSPLFAFATVNFMIYVSTKVSSTRDAQQMGSFILIPLMIVVFGGMALVLVYSELLLLGIIGVMIVVDIVLAKIGMSILDREKWISKI